MSRHARRYWDIRFHEKMRAKSKSDYHKAKKKFPTRAANTEMKYQSEGQVRFDAVPLQ